VHAPSGGFPNGPAQFRLKKQPSAAGTKDGAPAKKKARRTKAEMEQERAEQDAAKHAASHALQVQAKTGAFWRKPQRRIVRWQKWKGRRSADDQLVERVGKTFGAGAVIADGSAAGWHAMKGHAPTPTTGLRRRMEVRPELLGIRTPEAYTTKTCCRCGLQTVGPDPQRTTTTTDRSGVQKTFPARGVRRCNSAYCEGRRWKRDLNAAINIRRNLKHYLASADGRWMRFRQPLPGENAEAEDEDEDESDADEDGAAPQAVAPQPPAAAQQAPANTGAF
jgi:hypothetical protein